MPSQNKYIGDDKFIKLLEHYHCPAPLSLIKLRFAGAICSPNLELRPSDTISSLWEQGKSPRLQTKEEAELFFKFFMGLWDEIFEDVKKNQITLPRFEIHNASDLIETCFERRDEIEEGFLEGFWGGAQNIKIPAYIAQIVDSLSELAGVYEKLSRKSINDSELENLIKTVSHTDKTVNRSIAFIVENFALPRMSAPQVNLN
ncbi:MAG: hypothetical protein IJ689_01210 [Alphaproteobacteria bacterium]|nr:hypothetical protein [Alphaproteobacteria bacterium]